MYWQVENSTGNQRDWMLWGLIKYSSYYYTDSTYTVGRYSRALSKLKLGRCAPDKAAWNCAEGERWPAK